MLSIAHLIIHIAINSLATSTTLSDDDKCILAIVRQKSIDSLLIFLDSIM